MADREYISRMTKKLADEGKLMEAGWMAMRLHVIAHNAPAVQLEEMRFAFMAGAQHLFASLNDSLDADKEPTEHEMKRMALIDKELREFAEELKARIKRRHGH